jgi:hypothetical protein
MDIAERRKLKWEEKTLAFKMRLLAGKPVNCDDLDYATLLLHIGKLAAMESDLETVKICIKKAAAAIFDEERKKGDWRDKYRKLNWN